MTAGALVAMAFAGLAACGDGTASLSATRPTGVWHVRVPGASSGGAAATTSLASGPSPTGEGAPTGTGQSGTGSAPAGTVTGGSPGAATSTTSAAPTSSSTTTTAAPLTRPAGTGAYGYVTAGPTCPVERPDQPCPPRAVTAEVDARDGSGATVASTGSDASGRYSLGLAPGRYTLVVFTPGGPRCPDTPVTVGAGAPTRADISCDTGIR